MAQTNLGRNIAFPIYSADGTPFHDLVLRKASVNSVVMSLGDTISGDVYYRDNTLTFTMSEYVEFKSNPDDPDETPIKYVIVNPPAIVRDGMVSDNSDLKGMTRYSLTFYHPMYILGNLAFSDVAVTNNELRYLSQNKTFAWIGNLFEFRDKLNANLANTEWGVVTAINRYEQDGVTETEQWRKATTLSEVLQFDKQYVSDALKTAYDTWKIPFTIDIQRLDTTRFFYKYSDDGISFTQPNVPTLGRNLLLRSNVIHSNTNYLIAEFDFGYLRPQAGQTVTITIHGRLGSDRYYFRVYNSTASCLIKTMNAETEIESYRTWSGSVVWTLTDSRGNQVANDKVLIYQYPSSGLSASTIEWIKVEIGNTRTAYSIAPEEDPLTIGTTVGTYIGAYAKQGATPQPSANFDAYTWSVNKHFLVTFGTPSQEIYDTDGVTPFIFQFGQGVGLKNNSRTPKNNKIVTRIVGYGSERNIPFGYPQIVWYGNQDWDYTIDNDASNPNSHPIYKGIVNGTYVKLIKHPFTRTTLMPTVYVESVFNKVSPYISDGSDNPNYDPTLEIIDYYDAISVDGGTQYPNPINPLAPSVESHQFEDEYPRLNDAHIVSVEAYDEKTYISENAFNALIASYVASSNNQNEIDVLTKTLPSALSWDDDYSVSNYGGSYTFSLVCKHHTYNNGLSVWWNIRMTSDNVNFDHNVYMGSYSPALDVVWDDTMNDEGEYVQSYFKLTLPQLDFDLYACASITEEMQINMRSGACMGCTFPIEVDWDDYKKNFYDSDGNFDPVIGTGHPRNATKYPDSSIGRIAVIVKKDLDTFGTLMPNTYQMPKGESTALANDGDAFVILGISLPQSYITNAQQRLDDTMKEYMLENNVYYFDYPIKFDEYFLATHTNILTQIKNNSVLRFMYGGTPMALYIKQISIRYGQSPLPQYDITLTDDIEVVLNQIGQVTDDVSRMRVQVSELQKYYNEGVPQAINEKLSRVVDDVCQGRITFQQGLNALGRVILSDEIKSNNYTSGLYNGRGWRIDELGNAELESLRVRSYMEVVELLINRMQAQEGDTLFTDNDQIDKVEKLVDSTTGAISYILSLKEKWDGYVTSQQVGNILKGTINTLAAKEAGVSDETSHPSGQGQDDGQNKYYTSWMRVIADSATSGILSTNQIQVVLYGDNEVPSEHNFEPCELMTIARWGCIDYGSSDDAELQASIKRRQVSFYISTSEGRIVKLTGVNKPILEEGNYGMVFGNIPDFIRSWNSWNRLVAQHPHLEDRDYLYAQGLIYQDLVHVDIKGAPVPVTVDCGDWIDGSTASGTIVDEYGDTVSLPTIKHGFYFNVGWNPKSQQFERHTVRHRNGTWVCLQNQPVVSDGTTTYYPPSWNSPYWGLIDGNGNYSMEFVSSQGDKFYVGHVSTTITPHLFYGNVDITPEATSEGDRNWYWTRETESGKTDADRTWDANHTSTKVLVLTNADMPTAWGRGNRAVFTCYVVVNDGRDDVIIQNQLIM